MYLPTHFKITEQQLLIRLIQQYSFGTLVTSYQNKLEVNQAPFLVDEKNENIICHLAKTNNHWELVTKADDLKVCFSGPDAYVSPNWYSEPMNNVPTWNFIHIQVSGKAKLLDEKELVVLLEKLSDKHESQFEQPWKIEKMEPKKFKAMLKAIVGIEISIDSIEGKAKLSQNKLEKERELLIEKLSQQNNRNSQSIANWMKKVSR